MTIHGTNLDQLIRQAIDRRRDEYTALLADLVRCPTTLGNEAGGQARLLAHLQGMGLQAEAWDIEPAELQDDPRFVRVDRAFAGRPNVTATLPAAGAGGRSLLFNGHIDVVSPEPLARWTRDPWGGEIDGGWLYGRGAYDMKAGLVQALLAIQAVMDAGVSLRGPVHFESVIEEECTGNGTLAARRRAAPVDAVVLPECVGLVATVANTGAMWVGVTVEGKAAYVGRAGEYVNAIEKAATLIPRLGSIADEINARFTHPAYAGLERPFTFSVGTIEGGDWPSTVPLQCRFVCRLSFPPGVPAATIRELVERHIQEAARDDPWLAEHPPRVDYPGFQAEGWAAGEDDALLGALAGAHTAMLGEPLTRNILLGTADARYFGPSEQCVYYGPAGGGQHGPDEYVELESIFAGAGVLARLIVDWCG